MNKVRETRLKNQDVFGWPNKSWSILFTIEELTELARYVQLDEAPWALRNSLLNPDDIASKTIEWGQGLMMHLTTGILMGIDPDLALDMALDKIDKRSERERERAKKANSG